MRILAIDPGEKNIGLALSDPTATIANPWGVIVHISRDIDAAQIAQVANENKVGMIVVGQALGMDGEATVQSRRANRLAGAIRRQTCIPVVFWDETGSTQEARNARMVMGASRHKRGGHLDELAATVILQSYLDSHDRKDQ